MGILVLELVATIAVDHLFRLGAIQAGGEMLDPVYECPIQGAGGSLRGNVGDPRPFLGNLPMCLALSKARIVFCCLEWRVAAKAGTAPAGMAPIMTIC